MDLPYTLIITDEHQGVGPDGLYRTFVMDGAALGAGAAEEELAQLRLWLPGFYADLAAEGVILHAARRRERQSGPFQFPVYVAAGRDQETVKRAVDKWRSKIEETLPFFHERAPGDPLHASVNVAGRADMFRVKAAIQKFAPFTKKVRLEPMLTLSARYRQLSEMIGMPYITMADQDRTLWLHVQHAEHLVAAKLIELI